MHAKGHFILGCARERFGVAELLVGSGVDCVEGIQHEAPVCWGDAGGILDVEDGIAGGSERDAGVA